jgi:hypothetical protein
MNSILLFFDPSFFELDIANQHIFGIFNEIPKSHPNLTQIYEKDANANDINTL